tara:strand:+ start:554 stop:1024 length:471 start_codon:yes stop_codon:yes gene_type:complete
MATMKTFINEQVTLAGVTHRYRAEKEISGINEVYHRVTTVPASTNMSIASFKTANSTDTGNLDLDSIVYIRITNLDSSNSVTLNLLLDLAEDGSAAGGNVALKLDAGKSFIHCSPHDGIMCSDSSASAITDLKDLQSILVDSGSNSVNIEVLIGIQ